jgi:hypothetical protein
MSGPQMSGMRARAVGGRWRQEPWARVTGPDANARELEAGAGLPSRRTEACKEGRLDRVQASEGRAVPGDAAGGHGGKAGVPGRG